MQKFNATNVVLNSIRLATPSVKVAGGEEWKFAQFRKVLRLRRKTAICPGFAKKNAKISRFCGVLVELRWRSLNGLGCDEMQKFNATNVVLNSIRLATPCKSGVSEDGSRSLEKFCAEKRQFVPVCEEKS